MDKNTLLASLDDRFIDRAAAAVARHRMTERIDPRTGDALLYGYVTLDCRDGVHAGCESCDCSCHGGLG